MNRRTFLTGLAASAAAITTIDQVAKVLPAPTYVGLDMASGSDQTIIYAGRRFWISGPQTISFAGLDCPTEFSGFGWSTG